MKKRLLMLMSILVIIAMALSFAACGNSDKDDDEEDWDMDSIAGTWEAKLDMGEMMGLDFEVEATVTLKADEDGTYELTMDPDSILKSLKRSGDDFIEYILEMQGLDMTPDEFFDMAGMTRDEFFEQMAESMDTESFNTSGEYTYEDGVLTIDGEEIECEYTGDELIFESEGVEFKFTR